MNLLAVVVAGVASLAVGMLWYNEKLMGKEWMRLLGLTKKEMHEAMHKSKGNRYLFALLSALVMSYVLALVLEEVLVTTLWESISVALVLWVGFVVTVKMSSVLWEHKPFELYLLNVGQYLVSLVVMASILYWMG